nr:MAG TPA: hypothetical protein [Caudoviricetes sp.]
MPRVRALLLFLSLFFLSLLSFLVLSLGEKVVIVTRDTFCRNHADPDRVTTARTVRSYLAERARSTNRGITLITTPLLKPAG